MNEQKSKPEVSTNAGQQAGQVWETPTIEEMDFASTESNIGGPGADGGLYQS